MNASSDASGLSESQWNEETLREWIAIDTTYRDKRRFLEVHSELLDERSTAFCESAMDAYADDLSMRELLRDHASVLADTLRRGSPQRDAVRDAYVNLHGGLTLEIPSWLEEIETQLDAQLGTPMAMSGVVFFWSQRAALLSSSIARAEREYDAIAPSTVATLRLLLWRALDEQRDDSETKSASVSPAGIALLEAALSGFPATRYPVQRLEVLVALASAHRHKHTGSRAENLEQSGSALHEAVELHVREVAPTLWAKAQHDLGDTYFYRIYGAQEENTRNGINCCEAALSVYTEAETPREWALTHVSLGNLRQRALEGGRNENIERALDHYQNALRVLTPDTYPEEYAMTQNNRGVVLRTRINGDPIANAEFAMLAHTEALKVFTREHHPLDYAWTLCNMAAVSLNRPAVSRRQNIESAIRAYQEALTLYTLEAHPEEYAFAQHNLGLAYADKDWEHAEAIELAIKAYQEALRVYTRNGYPDDHARTLTNLASAYIKRSSGNRSRDLARAIAYYQEALAHYTAIQDLPMRRMCLLGLIWPEAERGNWAVVHEHYALAFSIEEGLLQIEAGEEARAAVLKEGRDTALRDGFALARLGQVEQAVVAIERGRARDLAETMSVEMADSSQISNVALRERFERAREHLASCRRALFNHERSPLTEETFLQEWDHRRLSPAAAEARKAQSTLARAHVDARTAFNTLLAEIRQTAGLADFMRDTVRADQILASAKQCGPQHALVYLVATPWGGMALAVLANTSDGSPQFQKLDLPHLTFDFVTESAQRFLPDGTLRIIGGFAHAQRGSALKGLMLPLWPGTTVRERAQAMAEACRAYGTGGTLNAAAQTALKTPALRDDIDCPVEQMEPQKRNRLEATLNYLFLQAELQTTLARLADVAMRPLSDWLRRVNVKSVTLVPCGMLEAFPLTATPLESATTFADVFPTSIAPSARGLLNDMKIISPRSGVYALGDPHPTEYQLRWGEAEALTLAKLARMRGLPRRSSVQYAATRDWLLHALSTGKVVSASCHGVFSRLDFLQSSLLLAGGQRLTLAEVLSRRMRLLGLRLFILSACQTAIPDVRLQTDEIRSLAAALVAAGAQAVMGSLWPVDDKATYLLVIRFAQEWLPRMDHEPPAAALARAQRWLRTLTNRKLRAWQACALADFTSDDLLDSGLAPSWVAPWRNERSGLYKRQESEERGGEIAVRGAGLRYTINDAESTMRDLGGRAEPDACPFADPIYWAGFQIVGW